ncbi:GAF and ANTAR domain-containing protein [Nonomuraea rhizosphaerae]|uniref:GAF and ANTAR domain-containing protein n=1 Tax=Nonomuraea rhizosphaerae TaxID=2665663 RepID=UPI001C5DFB8C|nr:GAF and ANTAR domain-containing protein [Nonomuraea rhizosphaerae]
MTRQAQGQERAASLVALLTGHAAARGGPVTAADVCEVCVTALRVSGASVSCLAGTSAPRASGTSVPRVSGAAVRPVDGSGEVAAHAAGRLAERLGALGLAPAEGPCPDAWELGCPVLVPELGTTRVMMRWPRYGPAALGEGARAVFAFPLRSGAISAGVLSLCRTTPGPLSDAQLTDALLVADLTIELVLCRPAHRLPRSQTGPLTGPSAGTWSRGGLGAAGAEVHQAIGMVCVQRDVGPGQALAALREHALTRLRPLEEVARDVVGRRLRLAPGDPSGDPGGDPSGDPDQEC